MMDRPINRETSGIVLNLMNACSGRYITVNTTA